MRTVQLPPVKEPVATGVTIVEWVAQEGATVAANDLLARGETESARVEIRAAAGGVLRRILVSAGKTVAWDAALAEIAEAGDPSPLPLSPRRGETSVPSPLAHALAPGGAVVPILMPQAGQSMKEGTIVEWRVAVGDAIREGQVIFEVETDKATIEVEADHAGRLARIVVAKDETVPVKTPVAYLAQSDADVDAYLAAQGAAGTEAGQAEAGRQTGAGAGKPAQAAGAQVTAAPPPPGASRGAAPSVSLSMSPSVSAPTTETGRVKASPAARKAAAGRGLDLAEVGTGSGPGGRILSTDVLAGAAVGARAVMAGAAVGARAVAAAQAAPAAGPTRRRMSAMRRAIARVLTASKQTIPHFYMKATFDAEPMLAFWQAQKSRFKCSLNDVIVMASARAIREFPAFRSRLEGDELVEFPTANVGIAVGMEDGLVVPVVMAADRLTFEQLAAETRRIVEAARSGKIEGIGQGVFTITNLGMFGVEEFSAIINPPEAAILAVSAIREAVVVRDGAMRPGRVMTVTLSCDHRVIDGLLAAKFLARFQEIVAELAKSEQDR